MKSRMPGTYNKRIICNHNQPYFVMVTLNSKADKPVDLISGSNWNLECWFLWREENQRTQRKTLGAGIRTNNKESNQESNPGHSGGRWELSPLYHPYIPKVFPVTQRQMLVVCGTRVLLEHSPTFCCTIFLILTVFVLICRKTSCS